MTWFRPFCLLSDSCLLSLSCVSPVSLSDSCLVFSERNDFFCKNAFFGDDDLALSSFCLFVVIFRCRLDRTCRFS